jgi:glycosyltransferase involved in cell wall biosynthesis
LKIAFISCFYPFRGGITQYNTSLYLALLRICEVKAYTFSRLYPKVLFPGKSQYVTKGDRVNKIPAPQILDTINPLTYTAAAKIILKDNPDIALTKYWLPFLAPSLGTAFSRLRKQGVKTISILDNVIPHERRLGDIALTKYFLRRIDAFIVMSESVRNDLLELKRDAKYKLVKHPLYNHFGSQIGMVEAREKLGIKPGKKVILFFGFIREYKGLDLLIAAMQFLPEDCELVIAGEVYGDFQRYENLIKEYSLSDRIYLHTRYIPDQEVPVFFSAADVCVLPYRSGTQSGIATISYHFNLPVIITNVGGLKEMVEDEKTGLVVKENSPESIGQAIRKYFEKEMKEKLIPSIQEYKTTHSWERLAEDTLELANRL